MTGSDNPNDSRREAKILLVDDEDRFRVALGKQLSARGYKVFDVGNGEDAIKILRHENPEVVVLDQKMPKMDGIQTLKELKKISPEVQVIMLTGHGSMEGARVTGKHDVFEYLQKPCSVDELMTHIQAARQERVYAMARHEIPKIERTSLFRWMVGSHNARPGFMILGAVLFIGMLLMPPTENLMSILTAKKSGLVGEKIMAKAFSEKLTLGAGQVQVSLDLELIPVPTASSFGEIRAPNRPRWLR